jgi:hypothetical protein
MTRGVSSLLVKSHHGASTNVPNIIIFYRIQIFTIKCISQGSYTWSNSKRSTDILILAKQYPPVSTNFVKHTAVYFHNARDRVIDFFLESIHCSEVYKIQFSDLIQDKRQERH